jgi:hypothetical protein
MRRITVLCVVAVMVGVCVWSSQSPARGQSVPSPTATSVPTPDVGDILSRSVKAEAALKSVHTNLRGGPFPSAHVVGDCINRPSAVLARFRLTGDEQDADGSLHHINSEIVARVVKGAGGDIRARVRPVGKRGAWEDVETLSTPGDLQHYIAGVCQFLYDVPEIRSIANDPDASDYVSYLGESTVGRRAVWVLSINFTYDAPGGCACSEDERLFIDERTLFWAEAQYEQSSPVSGEQWSAHYSRFNKSITIRLPKIGSTTP